jgi:mannosyltransferase
MTPARMPGEMRDPKKSVRAFPLLAGLVLAAAALLFSFFGITRSLRHDECCSVEISNTDWFGIIENLKVNAHTPPLYYFLLNLWMKLFGAGEAAVRSLSAVFYILSLFALYHLGKTNYDKKAGLLAAFLFMVSPMAIWHAQDARMYSLLPFLTILSTLYFFRLFFRSSGTKADFTLYVLVNILGTFTHYWFFFALLAQGTAVLLLVFRPALKKFLLAGALSIVPFTALWTPVFLEQLSNGGTSWMTRPGLSEFLSTFLVFFGGGMRGVAVYAALLALVLFEARGLKISMRKVSALKDFALQKENLALAIVAFITLLIPFLISQISPIYVVERYTVIALAPVSLLVAAFLARFGNRLLVVAFCALLLAAVIAAFLHRRTNPSKLHFRSITDSLIKNARPNDVFIFSSFGQGVDYYLERRNAENRFVKITFPAEMAAHPCWINEKRMLAEKGRLEGEAEQLVGRLEKLPAETKIWLLYGNFPRLDTLIKARLDHRFESLTDRYLSREDSVFKKIVAVYQKHGPPAVRAKW